MSENKCIVYVNRAFLTRSSRLFASYMLPICVVSIEGNLKHTGSKNKGKQPFWRHTLEFKNFSRDSVMKVQIQDQSSENQLICSGELSLSTIRVRDTAVSIPIRLYFDKVSAGTLDVEITIKEEEEEKHYTNIYKKESTYSNNSEKCQTATSSIKMIPGERELEDRKFTDQQMDRLLSSKRSI